MVWAELVELGALVCGPDSQFDAVDLIAHRHPHIAVSFGELQKALKSFLPLGFRRSPYPARQRSEAVDATRLKFPLVVPSALEIDPRAESEFVLGLVRLSDTRVSANADVFQQVAKAVLPPLLLQAPNPAWNRIQPLSSLLGQFPDLTMPALVIHPSPEWVSLEYFRRGDEGMPVGFCVLH